MRKSRTEENKCELNIVEKSGKERKKKGGGNDR